MPPAGPIRPTHVCLPHLEKYPEGKPPDPAQVLCWPGSWGHEPQPSLQLRAEPGTGAAMGAHSCGLQPVPRKKKKFEVWLRFCSSEETKINIINDYEQVGRNTSRGR